MYVGGTHVSYTLCIAIGEGLHIQCYATSYVSTAVLQCSILNVAYIYSKNELIGWCRTAFNSVVSLLVLFYVVTAGEHQP